MADERLRQELIQFCTYAVTTKSGQIRSKFWPELDLAGFPKGLDAGLAGAGAEIRYILR